MEKLLKEAKRLNISVKEGMSKEDIKKLISERKKEIQKENDDSVVVDSMLNSMMM